MKTSNLTGGQELLCINTEKVYDWIVNEATFDLTINDLPLPLNPVTGEQLECADIDLILLHVKWNRQKLIRSLF